MIARMPCVFRLFNHNLYYSKPIAKRQIWPFEPILV